MKGISFIFLFLASLLFYQAQAQELTGIDPRIQEVYKNNMDVFNREPMRLTALNRLLSKRVEIVKEKPYENEKHIKLSTIPLFDKYNKELERDQNFDPNTFNVLKYDLTFFSRYSNIYRIDGTDYILIIHPTTK